MKTDKISFPSVNGKIDSNLVRAMEALPSYSYATKPCVSGIECYMTKRDVIVYPSWLEATLFCVKQSKKNSFRRLVLFGNGSSDFALDNT